MRTLPEALRISEIVDGSTEDPSNALLMVCDMVKAAAGKEMVIRKADGKSDDWHWEDPDRSAVTPIDDDYDR
jgi:hypothetical protein